VLILDGRFDLAVTKALWLYAIYNLHNYTEQLLQCVHLLCRRSGSQPSSQPPGIQQLREEKQSIIGAVRRTINGSDCSRLTLQGFHWNRIVSQQGQEVYREFKARLFGESFAVNTTTKKHLLHTSSTGCG
jgi:hypothetical protein